MARHNFPFPGGGTVGDFCCPEATEAMHQCTGQSGFSSTGGGCNSYSHCSCTSVDYGGQTYCACNYTNWSWYMSCCAGQYTRVRRRGGPKAG